MVDKVSWMQHRRERNQGQVEVRFLLHVESLHPVRLNKHIQLKGVVLSSICYYDSYCKNR